MRQVIDPAVFRTPLPVPREDVPVPEFGEGVDCNRCDTRLGHILPMVFARP